MGRRKMNDTRADEIIDINSTEEEIVDELEENTEEILTDEKFSDELVDNSGTNIEEIIDETKEPIYDDSIEEDISEEIIDDLETIIKEDSHEEDVIKDNVVEYDLVRVVFTSNYSDVELFSVGQVKAFDSKTAEYLVKRIKVAEYVSA